MGGSQDETLKKAVFSGWHDHFAELKQQSKVAQMQQDMRAKGAESSKRMLGMLLGAQSETLLKASFSAWSECVYELRQLREVEHMRRNMRSKGDESAKRMLGMLMSSQADVLMKAAFTSWH